MKGQTINIDYTIALGLFLVSSLSGVLIMTESGVVSNPTEDLQTKLFNVQSEIEDAAYVEGRKTSLVTRTPYSIENVPVDREYIFSKSAYPGSGAMEVPAEVNISENYVTALIDLENDSFSMIYFSEDNSELSYSNNIQTADGDISNSHITVSPGGDGFDSLQIDGNEILNTGADLGSDNDTVIERDLHTETLDGNLNVYNNSPEIIIETDGSFELRNFTEIYWYGDGTENLEPRETFSGETSGFALASVDGAEEFGISFMGDMEAKVSKQSGTVSVKVNSSKYRLRPFNSSISTGRERVRADAEGNIFFGPSETVQGITPDKMEMLENMTENEFEETLNLQNFGYNITFGKSDSQARRGDPIPVNQDVVVSNLGAVLLDRKGNASLIENRVALWR